VLPADKAGPIRVLLVDDHELVRQAISLAFDGLPDIELVAQATLAVDGLVAARQHQPDVVLLDRRLPDGDAADVIGQFLQASPASRVLVFTGYADDEIAARVAAGERVLPPDSPGGALGDPAALSPDICE
jgi:DNA-binding NarL/FixJ family response regulator